MKIHANDVVAPHVHNNGTSVDELILNLQEVYAKLYDTREQLKKAAPNGRDYYIGNVSLSQASKQHSERMDAIDALLISIETEMELIGAQ